MTFQRAHLLEPRVVSPSAIGAATPVFPEYANLDVFWLLLQVRTMGTATYIKVGNRSAREVTFWGVGDFQVFDVPEGFTFNAADVTFESDQVDCVLEVSGCFPASSPSAPGG